jgi:uncharacterized membrane protein
MSDLVVVGYDNVHEAEEVRLRLLKLQREYLVDLGDAVVAVRQPDGKVQLHQIHNLTAAGALSGGFWGALIGLLFMSPLLKPGSSALFVLVRKVTADKVLEDLQGAGGRILKTSLSNEDEARLQAALDSAKKQAV